MSLWPYIIGQFRKPHGAVGHLAGWVMAHRGSNRERNAWTVGLLDIQPRERVLEIGCGPGLALAMCADRLDQGHIAGLDHSATMLDQARRRNADAIRAGRVSLHHGGLEALAELAGPFDKILSANVVQFLPDKAAAFRALFAVTAPAGMVASTYQPRGKSPSRDAAFAFANEVAAQMSEAGFTDIRTEELPLEPVPAICVIGRRPEKTH